MKKVIFSSFDDLKNPYYGGGGSKAVHEIAKRLVYKYKVEVLTSKYPGSKNEVIDKVYYERIGGGFQLPIIGQFLSQIVFQLFLPYFVLTKKYDLWFESFTPPVSTNFLPLFTKKPVIGLVHMLSAEDMQRKYKLPFKLVENLGLKVYSNFVVVTSYLKDQIKNVNKEALVEIITNGVDLPLKQVKKNKNYILFLGRIEINQKGLDLLLKALKNIENKTSCNLVIAGGGLEVEVMKLRNLIKKFNLEKRVQLLGKVDGKKKMELIGNSLFLVMPSRFETFGIVALEGFTFKKPIVVFNLKMLEWISDEVCLKVKPFDIAKFGDALLKLTSNNKLRIMMGEKAYKQSLKFSWDKSAKKYDELIEKVLYNLGPKYKSFLNFRY